MTPFQTERLTVRPFRETDTDALFPILSDPVVMRYIEPPFTYEQTADFLRQAGLCHPPLVYAVVRTADDTLLGHLIWHPYDGHSYELGWVLGREFWGQGYANELTEALISFARPRGIPALVMECGPDQAATVHIAEKHGFVFVGQQDNLAVYRLSLAEH